MFEPYRVILPMLVLFCAAPVQCADVVELLDDPDFTRGLNVRGTDVEDRNKRNLIEGKLIPGWDDREPAWLISQWYSKASISDAPADYSDPSRIQWQNDYKTIAIGKPDTTGVGIYLAVDAFKEFKGVYRDGTQKDWPHLLVSQRISGDNGHLEESSPSIGSMAKMDFRLSYRIISDQPHKNEQWHRNRHAARFRVNLTIQNLRPDKDQNKEYGQFIWFVITLYDDRHEELNPVKPKIDKASRMMIYNVGLEPFQDKAPKVGEWNHLEADILPYIKEALEYAWAYGILTKTRDLEYYKIGSMNFGYEVTGLNTINAQVRNLRLQAVLNK